MILEIRRFHRLAGWLLLIGSLAALGFAISSRPGPPAPAQLPAVAAQ